MKKRVSQLIHPLFGGFHPGNYIPAFSSEPVFFDSARIEVLLFYFAFMLRINSPNQKTSHANA